MLHQGAVVAEGTPEQIRAMSDSRVQNFIKGLPPEDGGRFEYPVTPDYESWYTEKQKLLAHHNHLVAGGNSMFNWIATLGSYVIKTVEYLGNIFILLLQMLGRTGFIFKRPRLLIQQIHFIGVYSLLIIAVSGLFVGFVLGFQGYSILSMFGSEQALGMMVALSLLRELGPVVTALLFAGRAGTSMTAEIGLMKAGEQLDAVEVMGINPIERILVPRFWGGVIAMPILGSIFSAVGILGGWFVGVISLGVDDGSFWSQMQAGVDVFDDVLNGAIKSLVFGVACMLSPFARRWTCRATAGGRQATTPQPW
ncbi:hypothetical protein OURE66S_04415 [Oligella ureolytica]